MARSMPPARTKQTCSETRPRELKETGAWRCAAARAHFFKSQLADRAQIARWSLTSDTALNVHPGLSMHPIWSVLWHPLCCLAPMIPSHPPYSTGFRLEGHATELNVHVTKSNLQSLPQTCHAAPAPTLTRPPLPGLAAAAATLNTNAPVGPSTHMFGLSVPKFVT